MRWEAVSADHIGSRSEQQDRLAAFSADEGTRMLLVLADGAGGHSDGAAAAEAVVRAAEALWQDSAGSDESSGLLDAVITRAHDAIKALAGEGNDAPRSTCVLLHLISDRARWLSVGDSRLYHVRSGQCLSRTRDHSVAQMLADLGRIEQSAVDRHPDQSRLLQSLGGDRPLHPNRGHADLGHEDGFVLCSDGVWSAVSEDALAHLVDDRNLRPTVSKMLARIARRSENRADNLSVIVARPVRNVPNGST